MMMENTKNERTKDIPFSSHPFLGRFETSAGFYSGSEQTGINAHERIYIYIYET